MRSPERLTVPIVLDRAAARPLHDQLIDAMCGAIQSGLLPAGSRLPSTRMLAQVLGISRGVAVTAYEQLYAAGTIRGTAGSGTYVSDHEARHTGARRMPAADPVDLRPGQAPVEGFPLAAWRSAWRHASHDAPPPCPPPAGGTPELRAAVTEHVRREHGIAGTGHEVVITSGARHAIAVLLRATGRHRARCVLADSGPAWLRDAVTANGADAVTVPVDAGGLRVDRLPDGTDLVLVAPEGDLPTGARAPLSRRVALAAWAERTGGWLVEIARAAVTDPNVQPLPGLLPLGPRHRTALIGDLTEILTPAIGLGYLMRPPAEHTASTHEQPSLLCQRAATELFRSGSVARRAGQLAIVHRRKLAIVRETLAPAGLPVIDSRTPGIAAVPLPPGLPADCLIERCRAAGVLLAALHTAYARPDAAPNGLLIGFGHLGDAVLRVALRDVVAEVAGQLQRRCSV